MRHEELYIESRKYLDAVAIHFLPYREVMKEELTFDEAFDMTIQHGESKDYEPHRVSMLLDLYFPELRASFDDVLAISNQLHKAIAGYKRQYKSGDTDGARWLSLFNPLLDSLVKRIEKFKLQVAEANSSYSLNAEIIGN